MTVLALTRSQRDAVADLVRASRVEALAGGEDETRARSFLTNAEAATSDLQRVGTVLVRHDLAYSVMHDVGEAMLSAYGYRTTRAEGQHEAVALFLAAVFDAPPPSEAAAHVDIVRRNRNDRYYRAHEPSAAEAQTAAEYAQILLEAAQLRLPSA
jgi:hypothetical protein